MEQRDVAVSIRLKLEGLEFSRLRIVQRFWAIGFGNILPFCVVRMILPGKLFSVLGLLISNFRCFSGIFAHSQKSKTLKTMGFCRHPLHRLLNLLNVRR